MNEKQLLGYLLLVLRNAGYKRAIDALIEDAAERGFTVTKVKDDVGPDGYVSVDYTLDDGVIRGHRLTDQEARDYPDIVSRDELKRIVEEGKNGQGHG